MEGLDRFIASAQADDRRDYRRWPGDGPRRSPQTGNRITIGAETQAESAMESKGGSASGGAGRGGSGGGGSGSRGSGSGSGQDGSGRGGSSQGGGRRSPSSGSRLARPRKSDPRSSKARSPNPPRPNPIERYIACFATARAAAEAAGVSTAMLRRMRARGYVSTRDRALLMAQACGFKIQPAELLALTLGNG